MRTPVPPVVESPQSFTILDWIGALVTGGSVFGLVGFPLVGSTYVGMYEDFGASASLPLLTRLVISGWFPPLLAATAAAPLALGLRPSRPLAQRRLWVVGAFLLGWGALGLCVVGLYLPIFALAGAVGAE